MLNYIRKMQRRDEQGASAVEYGLLVAAIAAIIVLIVFAIGKFVREGFSDTCTAMEAQSSLSTNVGTDCS